MARIACIGSRELAGEWLNVCEKLGEWIVRCGHVVESGNAQGADQAFARGGNRVDPTKVHLHLPWLSYERSALVLGNHVDVLASMGDKEQQTYKNYAKAHHPAWFRLSNGGQLLHARNGRILFPNGYPGKPVDLVLAWPSRKLGGGTGQGIRMAHAEGIPLVDLDLLVPDYLEPPTHELHFLCEQVKEMK